jgi:hypothetical protein
MSDMTPLELIMRDTNAKLDSIAQEVKSLELETEALLQQALDLLKETREFIANR